MIDDLQRRRTQEELRRPFGFLRSIDSMFLTTISPISPPPLAHLHCIHLPPRPSTLRLLLLFRITHDLGCAAFPAVFGGTRYDAEFGLGDVGEPALEEGGDSLEMHFGDMQMGYDNMMAGPGF
ncbi:hypothetical protein B0H16DRAFT_1731837 [Mycena metata]|uniref:Uncharacterized protein n=1 Tax=Mycena metata TaxID=1033252 RepID=A0AAD7I506_9AGAR|nr:hypothetical protein B0H16DRAFT_1731837 [Mycena metata]